jgi:ACT domain-containing protein
MMRAFITVIGRDNVGIIAKVSGECSKYNVNILDITQSVFKDFFAMIMLVDVSGSSVPFDQLIDKMDMLGKSNGLEIHTMHEDIFNSMHRI